MGRRKFAPQPPSPSSNSVADQGNAISDYEQQRLLRIRENRARLEALGLPNLASSLLGFQQSSNRQPSRDRKRKNKALDDDYQPSDDEDGDNGESSSSSEGKYSSPASESRRKGKQKVSNVAEVKSRSSLRKSMRESDAIDDDEALQQAISLSLGEAKEDLGTDRGLIQNSGSNVDDSGSRAKKSKANIKGNAGRRNTRKESKSRVQLTEDEVVAYFFSFDEAGKGHITLRDLQRMVAAHDFTWTDTEISHMIHSFDSDGDGKESDIGEKVAKLGAPHGRYEVGREICSRTHPCHPPHHPCRDGLHHQANFFSFDVVKPGRISDYCNSMSHVAKP